MPMDTDLLSERPGFHPVCLEDDAVNDDEFDGTPGLHSDLEEVVGHCTAGDLLDGIEQDQVRETLLPHFLLPVRERMDQPGANTNAVLEGGSAGAGSLALLSRR